MTHLTKASGSTETHPDSARKPLTQGLRGRGVGHRNIKVTGQGHSSLKTNLKVYQHGRKLSLKKKALL